MTDYDELIAVFASTTDTEKMKQLLDELLTPHEKKSVLLRWNLMNDLYQGMPQRGIASKYGISLCKVTRGSRILKQKDSYSRRLLSDKYDDHIQL
ncbi:Trp family transcriptional regulator [Parasphaerochaeta coccoides]|uniref:Trp repressor n=1 Tax=Parasphaerochaeta coccoides (strain ATCC BAA-1237 / DSM 17374 / SPN1) TaxID=760011 RepID=F4GH57_PARC1|nr:Trp family transcriptional regulator [Parasphaerochaeta coccoides]AEC01532.1 Trp repressor [Parasphaerochaeta coccoides DSM 17374]